MNEEMAEPDCSLCLEESKGKLHTKLIPLGPGKDIWVCHICDLLPLKTA